MKVHRWLAALGSALILVLSPLGARTLHAQTLTITGCATFTYNGGSGTGTISITCNPTSTPPAAGAPTCQSLTVSPPNDSTPSALLTLTASCTAGSSPIASYTLTGPGITPPGLTQTVASLGAAANTFTQPPPTATTTYSVTASDGTVVGTAAQGMYTVGSTSTGSVDMSACTAAGFTGVLVDLPYSVVQNQRVISTGFGAANALVVRFTVPSVTSDTASMNIVQSGTSQSIYHLATLSALPCQFATQAAPTGNVLAATYGTSPSFSLGVNVPVFTQYGGATTPTLLQPGTTYFITIVNRNGYYGTPSFTNSCASAGKCDVNVNFVN